MATSSALDLPYHLRAPRLRWVALALDLSQDEVCAFELMTSDPSQPLKVRNKAAILLGLHRRLPIHDLCEELHMDRRTLFRAASELSESSARRRFLIEHRAV